MRGLHLKWRYVDCDRNRAKRMNVGGKGLTSRNADHQILKQLLDLSFSSHSDVIASYFSTDSPSIVP